MDRDVVLVLAGGDIGLMSSRLTTLVNYLLQGRRPRERLEREDRLRHEETERDRRLYLDGIERQNRLMAIDMLWRDMQRLEELAQNSPPEAEHGRPDLEKRYDEFARRRE